MVHLFFPAGPSLVVSTFDDSTYPRPEKIIETLGGKSPAPADAAVRHEPAILDQAIDCRPARAEMLGSLGNR